MKEPKIDQQIYFILPTGHIMKEAWLPEQWDYAKQQRLRLEFGNVFSSEQEAKKAAEKIKELLSS